MCRAFAMTGTCRFGSTCKFRHIQPVNGSVHIPIPTPGRRTRDGPSRDSRGQLRNGASRDRNTNNGTMTNGRTHGRPITATDTQTSAGSQCRYYLQVS
jgi:hypothetical protein